ncbi:MAG TPA: hypothetical protein VNW15_12340 [Rhizomicrobium sp.]|jgi:hypothetical protein|nr:hypothetical protein [Rhizomicrobium sp.]
MTGSTAEDYAALLNRKHAKLKQGTLRFWGVWFGRPNDSWHRIVACDAEPDLLKIRFNDSELLSVWSPSGLEADTSKFQISDASRVRWEWFYYGRPQTPANLFFYDFSKGEKGTSDVNWYEPDLRPQSGFPAVEIL